MIWIWVWEWEWEFVGRSRRMFLLYLDFDLYSTCGFELVVLGWFGRCVFLWMKMIRRPLDYGRIGDILNYSPNFYILIFDTVTTGN